MNSMATKWIAGHRCGGVWPVLACALVFTLPAGSVEAGCKVAVVNGGPQIPEPLSGVNWCNFLNSNGYECTLFPVSGPTSTLDPFPVIFNLSQEWADPGGLLADQMRARKTVITWGEAPRALGIDTNPEVQAWIGATTWTRDDAKLFTVVVDPIFGSMPPGSEVHDCTASLCTALDGTTPASATVLARWDFGTGEIGILRNTWEGGRSYYFHDFFRAGYPPDEQIMIRTLEISCRPIPTISTWGIAIIVFAILIGGSLIIRSPWRTGNAAARSLVLLIITFCMSHSQARGIQQGPSIVVQENDGITALALNNANAQPFHMTEQTVQNARIVQIGNTTALYALWDEVQSDGNAYPFSGISLDADTFGYVMQTSNNLSLRFATFDPSSGDPVIPAELVADSNNTLYVIQLVAQPIEASRAVISQLGAEVLGFVPENALIVGMESNILEQVSALEFVRAVRPFHAAYKIEEGVITEILSANASEPRVYSILLWKRGEAQQVALASQIAQLGGCVRRIIPEQQHIVAALTLEQARQVAGLPSVAFIDVPGDIEPAMSIARFISGASYLGDQVPGFDGAGVCGEVMDTGLRTTHMDFQNPPPLIHSPFGPNLQAHGTSVYGIIFGKGIGNEAARGILPGAEQGFITTLWSFDDPPASDCQPYQRGGRFNHVAELVHPNWPFKCVLQNNSWGHEIKTGYTVISTEMDDISFVHDLTICQAQGNDGNRTTLTTLSLPEAWAKNVLSVGGVYHGNNSSHEDDKWCPIGSHGCASIGPASDGRVKPDLVHFFDNVLTTDSDGDSAYGQSSGTSAAAPITCGYAGLVYQMWHESVFNVWSGTTSVPTGVLEAKT